MNQQEQEQIHSLSLVHRFKMEKDISKRTVIVLLVLTILVTGLGVWTVMERLSISEEEPVTQLGSSAGQVRLTILPQPELEQEQT